MPFHAPGRIGAWRYRMGLHGGYQDSGVARIDAPGARLANELLQDAGKPSDFDCLGGN